MNDHYAELYHSFQWWIPPQFNIADACLYRWANTPSDARRTALVHHTHHHERHDWTFGQLAYESSRLANGLQKMGVEPGDRVGLLAGQSPYFVVALMAILGLGATAVPITTQLTTPELAHCLNQSHMRVAIVDQYSFQGLVAAHTHCPLLTQLISIDFEHELTISWRTLLARQSGSFTPKNCVAQTPALLMFHRTSMSDTLSATLLPHSSLVGNLPGFVCAQNWAPLPDDHFWTPHDWRSNESLLSALLPCLYFGIPIHSTDTPVSPETALDLIESHDISNILLSVQALQRMLDADQSTHTLANLRAIAYQGEDTAGHVFHLCEETLGITPNPLFNLHETGCILTQSHEQWPSAPGAAGRAVPGHYVIICDAQGNACSPGTLGYLAIGQYDIHGHGNPSLCLGHGANSIQPLPLQQGLYVTSVTAHQDTCGNIWIHTSSLESRTS